MYEASIANTGLVRSYLKELIAAGLVQLSIRRGCRWIQPTGTGMVLADKYLREIRGGTRTLEQAI